MGITRATKLVIGVINLLTKFPMTLQVRTAGDPMAP